MIRHIVMWTLKDEIVGDRDREENIALLLERLNTLKQVVPGVLSLEARRNENPADPQAFDVVLFSEFNSWKDLAAYQTHPEHRAVGEFAKTVRKDRAAVDYEVR